MFEANRFKVTPCGANKATISFGIGLKFLKIIKCVYVHVCKCKRTCIHICVYVCGSQRMTLNIVLSQLLSMLYIWL